MKTKIKYHKTSLLDNIKLFFIRLIWRNSPKKSVKICNSIHKKSLEKFDKQQLKKFQARYGYSKITLPWD